MTMQPTLGEFSGGTPAPAHLVPVAFPATNPRRFAHPTHISRIPRGTDIAEALAGAALQGLPLLRHGEEIAAVMQAVRADRRPLYDSITVILPRRSAKTTSVWSVLLGRCQQRPGTKIVTTAQDGIRARARFRDVQRALQRGGFESRGNKLRWANGDESIEWANGSRMWVVPPEAGAFRGEAADLMFFDEAGELSPARSDDLVAGALPLMDTRPMGQVVIAGTPGDARAGLLWDSLQAGIDRKHPGSGVVAYMAPDTEPSFLIDTDGTPTVNRKLLRRVHPGIGTLTNLATIVGRLPKMGPSQWEREYLCRFPLDTLAGAIDAAAWTACGTNDELPTRPDKTAWAFDVEPDGSTAALVVAWRDPTGKAIIELAQVEHGTTWLAAAARAIMRKHRGSPIGCDNVGANSDAAARLESLGVRLQLLGMRHTIGAAARFDAAVTTGQLHHHNQPLLNEAVAGAVWRNVGDSGRLFGRRASGAPVAPLVAATVALWLWDQAWARPRETLTITHLEGPQ